MQKISILVFSIFLVSFVSSVNVDFDCPAHVSINEEFFCTVTCSDISDDYDLKVEILSEGKTVAKIWSESDEKWSSAYNYLKGFVDEEEKEVRLMISKEGEYEGNLKLRQGDKVDIFPFEITAGSNEEKEAEEETVEKTIEKKNDETQGALPEKNNPPVVISLNSFEENSSEEILVYRSKSSLIVEYLPYAFCIFLLLIIAILLREKF